MVLPVVAPAVWALVAGAGAEAAYAWYDPDLFTKGLWSNYDLDRRVETLNNYWQLLWRASAGKLPVDSKLPEQLDTDMTGWVDFKQRYDDAIFRRAIDPWALWGAQAQYEDELNNVWLPRFTADMQAFIAQDQRIREALAQKGVDLPSYLARSGLDEDGQPKGSHTSLYVGVGVTVVLIGIGAAIAIGSRPRSRWVRV